MHGRSRVGWTLAFAVANLACILASLGAAAAEPCPGLGIDAKASTPLGEFRLPSSQKCVGKMSHGFPIPDPRCTPGATNATLTLDVLKSARFTTRCVRDKATSAQKKANTYDWYGVQHPEHNTGRTQTCELDHLVSLELGGADTLSNIWPQCGPSGVPLEERFFKEKDRVENYLATRVCQGQMDLAEAQRGIAKDWTQYLSAAEAACDAGNCGGCK